MLGKQVGAKVEKDGCRLEASRPDAAEVRK